MLVTLNDVMMIAEQQGIAIGAFNTPNLEAVSYTHLRAHET